MNKQRNIRVLGRLFSFLLRVLRSFKRNQGLLLSGSLAYYALLSIVPMSILALIVLSNFIGEERLFHTLSSYLEMVVPGYASALTEQVRVFLEHRKAVGIFGFIVMLFFSSIAFSVLEKALSVIFFHRARIKRRRFIISVIIPYLYIFLTGMSILLVSFITGALETLESERLLIFGWRLGLEGTSVVVLYILGIIGEFLMLTSIYLVMPVVHINFRHALIGGATVTILWEITRHALVWYYRALSNINLIYGSFATAAIALLSIDAVALILLLGAQVIAELESTTDAGKDNGPGR